MLYYSKLILSSLVRNGFKPLSSARQYTSAHPINMAYTVFETAQTDKTLTPLIIMHGLFGSKQNWRGIGKALSAKLNRQVFTVDARNHGDSPHSKEHSSIHMAADVSEFMRKHHIPKACVMGHSMGGRTMMGFALKYPEMVDRAIIVDISPISVPRDFSSMEEILTAMRNISVASNLTMAQGRAAVERQLKEAVEAQETVDFIMLNLRKRDNGEFYWACNVEALQNNLRTFTEFMTHFSELQPFHGKIKFICGNQSNFMDQEDWPQIQKIYPNAEIDWLDAGHLVHFDQPVLFMNLVVEFIKR